MSTRDSLKKLLRLKVADEAKLDKLVKHFKVAGNKQHRGNTPHSYKGHKYASLSEAYYAYLLDIAFKKNKIRNINPQVKYPLKGLAPNAKLSYIVDFELTTMTTNEIVFVEIKGRLTKDNIYKMSYWQYVYNKQVTLIYTKDLWKIKEGDYLPS